MKIVILQSNYLPWKGYFDLISNADIFCFLDEVQYTKNDWRNRNRLYSKNGLFWLTVPIRKDSVKLKISEVSLEDNLWQEKHYKCIVQTYSRAPRFEEILPLLKDIYIDRSWRSLSQMNQYIIRLVCEHIGLKTKIVNSKDYKLEDGKVERLVSLIKQIGGTEYISGPSAKNYLDKDRNLFLDNNIRISYKEYGPYSEYRQNAEVFENFVSIIDTLMFVPKENLLNYIVSG
jgi:hypothetical protein